MLRELAAEGARAEQLAPQVMRVQPALLVPLVWVQLPVRAAVQAAAVGRV